MSSTPRAGPLHGPLLAYLDHSVWSRMGQGRLQRDSVERLGDATGSGKVEIVASLWNLFELAKTPRALPHHEREAKMRVAELMDSMKVRRVLRPQDELLAHDIAATFACLTGRDFTEPSPFVALGASVREHLDLLLARRAAEVPRRLADLRAVRRGGPHAAAIPMVLGHVIAGVERARLGRGPRRWQVLIAMLDRVLGVFPSYVSSGLVDGLLAAQMLPEVRRVVRPPPSLTELVRLLEEIRDRAPLHRFLTSYRERERSDQRRNPDVADAIDRSHALAANFVDVIVHDAFAANQLEETARALGMPVKVFKTGRRDDAVAHIVARP